MSNARGPRNEWLMIRMAAEGMPVSGIARVLLTNVADVHRFLRSVVKSDHLKVMPPMDWPENTRISTRAPLQPTSFVEDLRLMATGMMPWGTASYLDLTKSEAIILAVLLQDGRVDSPTLRAISDGGAGGQQTLKVHMCHLRKKLRAQLPAVKIETVHGWGYCLTGESRALINEWLGRGTVARKARPKRPQGGGNVMADGRGASAP